MEPDNKLYIVVAVLAVILIGIFIYLFVMDRNVTKIEKEMKERDSNQHGRGDRS